MKIKKLVYVWNFPCDVHSDVHFSFGGCERVGQLEIFRRRILRSEHLLRIYSFTSGKRRKFQQNETIIKKEKPIVFNSLLAHENNFHCLAKAIDRISVALCSNNGDSIEVRLREFLVVSERLNKHINLEHPVVTDLHTCCNKVVVKLISGCVLTPMLV